MNSVSTALRAEIKRDIKKGGLDEYKAQALQHLELKTVVKESHCLPISCVAYNPDKRLQNLFATVGKDQVTVYDDQHMGDYIAVVVHFTNNKTLHHTGGELSTCSWVSCEGITQHPHGDACLAVSGADPAISIISVAEAKVFALLKGHTCAVVDLCSCSEVPGLLMSLACDGNVRLWDVPSQECIASYKTGALCAKLHPCGSSFVTGHHGGKLMRWPLHVSREDVVGDATSHVVVGRAQHKLVCAAAPSVQGEKGETLVLPGPLTDAVDSIQFLPGNRLVAKSNDGRIAVWSLEPDCVQLSSMRVPSGNSAKIRCGLSCTADGAYLVVGNSIGDVYIYDSSSGERAGHVSAVKVNGPVRSCALSDDCRHLLAVVGNGFIFRFEYVRPEDVQGGALEAAEAPAQGAGDVCEGHGAVLEQTMQAPKGRAASEERDANASLGDIGPVQKVARTSL